MSRKIVAAVTLAAACALLLIGCSLFRTSVKPGTVDEPMQAGLKVDHFKPAEDPYFAAMDGGIHLSPQEEAGRNMWIVWSGGNDRFWDTLGKRSVGTLDLLKSISTYNPAKDQNAPAAMRNPADSYSRNTLRNGYKYFRRGQRWKYFGMVNEPCFHEGDGGDPNRWGLWLDRRDPGCPADPFEDESRYPGVKVGSRGKDLLGKKNPVGSYYGYASGVVGLRLFPNPDFDEAAAKAWNATRYYTDPGYYNDPNLVRPYRIGMSCGFCHVGPHPLHPPANPEEPKWENLSSNVGAQYAWIDRIFAWENNENSFAFQVFHTYRPGALDTSLVSTDNINNPRTMNAIYNLAERLDLARPAADRPGLYSKPLHPETLAGGSRDNKQFNDFLPPGHPLTRFFQSPDKVWTPRVLKDGADSVGGLGALNRVYLNIGLFSEEWLQHFNPLLGGKRITPITIKSARANSIYWQATERQTPNTALFFLKASDPHRLADASPEEFRKLDQTRIAAGKKIFADRCARCHSSKLPPLPDNADPGRADCQGRNYLGCFEAYWAHTETPEFKTAMQTIVESPDFLERNYLSTDLRIPVTLLKTYACSPVASNAIAGNIWDNFSSQTYKELPSVGEIEVHDPFTGETRKWRVPGGGRGFTRPPSLISLWSTAPYLLNNTVGKLSPDEDPYTREGYNPPPDVASRLRAFNDGIRKMLWPGTRDKDKVLGAKGVFMIDRTTATSYLQVPARYVPEAVRKLRNWVTIPVFDQEGGIRIGPIPAGTPVNLIANLRLMSENTDLNSEAENAKQWKDLLVKLIQDLNGLGPNATDEQARKVFANVGESMVALSTCPDYEVNRGHYFGTELFPGETPLKNEEKEALIEFLKTF